MKIGRFGTAGPKFGTEGPVGRRWDRRAQISLGTDSGRRVPKSRGLKAPQYPKCRLYKFLHKKSDFIFCKREITSHPMPTLILASRLAKKYDFERYDVLGMFWAHLCAHMRLHYTTIYLPFVHLIDCKSQVGSKEQVQYCVNV